MPIYEFYCPDCHRVFSFLARTVGTTRKPDCPRCGRAGLDRRPSRFAVGRGSAAPDDAEGLAAFDDAALERAMAVVESEAASLDGDDPRQAGRVVRRLYEAAGLPLDGPVSEAIRRIEAGEDPDRIDEDLEGAFDDLDAARDTGRRVGRMARRVLPPTVDPTLYEL